MPPEGFEYGIPASKPSQTQFLDRAAAFVSTVRHKCTYILPYVSSLVWEAKFYTSTKLQEKVYNLILFMFRIVR